jgi:hypothetical protein
MLSFWNQWLSKTKVINEKNGNNDVFLIKAALMESNQAQYILKNCESKCQSKWLYTIMI